MTEEGVGRKQTMEMLADEGECSLTGPLADKNWVAVLFLSRK